MRLARLHQASPSSADGERAAIGVDAVGLLADGLEDVAVAHPQLWLVRPDVEQLPVEAERLFVAADAAEGGRLEAGVAEVGRAFLLDPLELGDRLGGPVLPVEHRGEVGPRGGEARRQLERAAQQVLEIAEPADACRQLGHHADGGNVGRPALEVRAKQGFGGRQVIGGQRLAGTQKAGIANRRGHLPGEIDRLLRAASHCQLRLGEGQADQQPFHAKRRGEGIHVATENRSRSSQPSSSG